MKEFADLFSRQVTARKPVKKADEASKPSKIQPAKILDSKRSKSVGILEKSLHVDFSEVENAVYNLDTSVVSLEALQQIYNIVSISLKTTKIENCRFYTTNVNVHRFNSVAVADAERTGGHKGLRGEQSGRSSGSARDLREETCRCRSLFREDSVSDVSNRISRHDLVRFIQVDEFTKHLRLPPQLQISEEGDGVNSHAR